VKFQNDLLFLLFMKIKYFYKLETKETCYINTIQTPASIIFIIVSTNRHFNKPLFIISFHELLILNALVL